MADIVMLDNADHASRLRVATRVGLIIGVSLVLAAMVGAFAVAQLKRAGDEVTVTGSAKRLVRADLAVWRLDVSVQGQTQTEATRAARDGAARTRAFLIAQGFTDSSLTVRAPFTMVQNEYINGNATGRILGYQVTQQIELRTPDVDKWATLAGDLGRCLDRGASGRPGAKYLYAKLPDSGRRCGRHDDARPGPGNRESVGAGVGGSGGSVGGVRHEAQLDRGQRLRDVRHVRPGEGDHGGGPGHLRSGLAEPIQIETRH